MHFYKQLCYNVSKHERRTELWKKEVHTLATELLHELKASAKRWFIIAAIELFIILSMAGGFIWYMSLPVEDDVVSVENEDGNANYVGDDVTGAIYNGEGNSTKDTQDETKSR